MSAAVLFNGVSIPGLVMPMTYGPPEIKMVRTKFFGLYGESEILGHTAGRPIEVPICLFGGFTTATLLRVFIEGVLHEQLIEVNSAVNIVSAASPPAFDNCTFLGFEMSQPGVLHDDAKTLDGGWFCFGVLKFYQLVT